jgi:hypothetical protein
MQTQRSRWLTSMALLLTMALPLQILAGPVLICHPYEIGKAKSLPWAGKEWRAVQTNYDLNHLAEDVLSCLTPQTPVIARMETIRRAMIYAEWAKVDHKVNYSARNDKVTRTIFEKLKARVEATERAGKPDALAIFDLGYFIESWRNSVDHRGQSVPDVNGYEWVKKASAMRNTDATMEFAAALITSIRSDKAVHQQHLQKAIAGAAEGSLLARNLVSHFPDKGRSLAEMRAHVGLAKR